MYLVGLLMMPAALEVPLLRLGFSLRPPPANAASVTYDFAYRFERALDPEKRGPATPDVDLGGMSALDAMCNPMPPPQDVSGDELKTAAEALPDPSTAAAAAAAAAITAVPPEPAASAEPIFGLTSAHLAAVSGPEHSLLVGLPLLTVVMIFLRSSRGEPKVDPLADAQILSVDQKIFSARSTFAPGFTFIEAAEDADGEEGTGLGGSLPNRADAADNTGLEEVQTLAREAAALAASARRTEELKAALEDAVSRQDFEAAAAIKREIDERR